MLYCDSYDLVLITETWLHSEISSGLLDPKSVYYVLRKDRADSAVPMAVELLLS